MEGEKVKENDIGIEVEKIIQAVAQLKDEESFEYYFPERSRNCIRIHVQRPYGLAIFGPLDTYPRTVLSPEKMRKLLTREFRLVLSGRMRGDSEMVRRRNIWAEMWEKMKG